MASLGGSVVGCVSLPENVGESGCKSRALFMEFIGMGVALGIGVAAALISHFLRKQQFLSVTLPDP